MPLYRILLEEGIASDTVYFDVAHQFLSFLTLLKLNKFTTSKANLSKSHLLPLR
jgi:hypothetical protein